jgi:hypothetical protein
MSVDDVGFVNVKGSVEPLAIAGAISQDIHRRIGEFLVLSTSWLEERGQELNQIQQVEIAAAAFRIMDGIERDILDELMKEVDLIRDKDEDAALASV